MSTDFLPIEIVEDIIRKKLPEDYFFRHYWDITDIITAFTEYKFYYTPAEVEELLTGFYDLSKDIETGGYLDIWTYYCQGVIENIEYTEFYEYLEEVCRDGWAVDVIYHATGCPDILYFDGAFFELLDSKEAEDQAEEDFMNLALTDVLAVVENYI